jgi:basic membrane lipoprotein Med (substrate-binding protein (PBP1-ABC) superfamily)
VGGVELPPVREAYEAWAAGARAVNPKVQSRLTYLNNWDDAGMGREAAMALVRAGVDMLHHNADAAGIGVFQAARESPGVYVFGANADQAGLAPERVIGSAVIDLPRAFLMVAREVRAGTLESSVKSFGLAGGVVRWVPNPALDSMVPPDLRVKVAAARDSISDEAGRRGGRTQGSPVQGVRGVEGS